MLEDGVLAKKPDSLTFEESATLPLPEHTAVFILKDQVKTRSGDQVLIIGASIAIGTFAVQLAKHYGAEVTGVCSTTNVEMVKSPGADQIIDYTKEDFTKTVKPMTLIFDAIHKSTFLRCKNPLKDKGIYLVTMPSLTILVQMLWMSIAGTKKVKNGSREAALED